MACKGLRTGSLLGYQDGVTVPEKSKSRSFHRADCSRRLFCICLSWKLEILEMILINSSVFRDIMLHKLVHIRQRFMRTYHLHPEDLKGKPSIKPVWSSQQTCCSHDLPLPPKCLSLSSMLPSVTSQKFAIVILKMTFHAYRMCSIFVIDLDNVCWLSGKHFMHRPVKYKTKRHYRVLFPLLLATHVEQLIINNKTGKCVLYTVVYKILNFFLLFVNSIKLTCGRYRSWLMVRDICQKISLWSLVKYILLCLNMAESQSCLATFSEGHTYQI